MPPPVFRLAVGADGNGAVGEGGQRQPTRESGTLGKERPVPGAPHNSADADHSATQPPGGQEPADPPHQHANREDSIVQDNLAAPQMPGGTQLNFDGISFPGVNCNCAPPDTNGEVGATQYMQIVNTAFQVWDKATVPPCSGRSASRRCGAASAASARRTTSAIRRPVRPARQPLDRQPVRWRRAPDSRVRRGLDLERCRWLVQPLRLRPRRLRATSTTTPSSACGPTRIT